MEKMRNGTVTKSMKLTQAMLFLWRQQSTRILSAISNAMTTHLSGLFII